MQTPGEVPVVFEQSEEEQRKKILDQKKKFKKWKLSRQEREEAEIWDVT